MVCHVLVAPIFKLCALPAASVAGRARCPGTEGQIQGDTSNRNVNPDLAFLSGETFGASSDNDIFAESISVSTFTKLMAA